MDSENHKSHIKDTLPLPVLYNGQGIYLEFWARANKLITALYMVTDVMDTAEPMRIKLRTLGADILSGMWENSTQVETKISGLLSFLNIASTVGMVSSMNAGILTKEFSALLEGIKRSRKGGLRVEGGTMSLEDFLKEEKPLEEPKPATDYFSSNMGQINRTRVGVQKGSTLMKVLSDKITDTSMGHMNRGEEYDVLKKERRYEIVTIIKGQKEKNPLAWSGLNITDIKGLAKGAIAKAGNKTLQRELNSMVKDGVLLKTGEKRWSKYTLAGHSL